ncbi:MAG: hypothetical protein ACE5LC_04015 [Candidatus Aminicenantales bacterium]
MSRQWGAQSEDLKARYLAIARNIPSAPLVADLKQLEEVSSVFKNFLPIDAKYMLAMVKIPKTLLPYKYK